MEQTQHVGRLILDLRSHRMNLPQVLHLHVQYLIEILTPIDLQDLTPRQ